jgi:hypothetical protein
MKHIIFTIGFLIVFSFIKVSAQNQSDLIRVNNTQYKIDLNKDFFSIRNLKTKAIIKRTNRNFVGFKFGDFDKDGLTDIFVEWGGNMPDRFSLFVFLKADDKYIEVEKFSDFPAAIPLKGTRFYYSYFRAGCADNAWGSDLFYIGKRSAIKIGRIKGDGCGIDDRIVVSRIDKDKTVEIERLPIETIQKFEDTKWGFIAQYWEKNFRKFL